MLDWLKPLLMMFYAPSRGLAQVRDRAPLGPAAALALVAQAAFDLYTQWPFVARGFAVGGAFAAFTLLRDAALSVLFVACVIVPALILFSNLFERRASFGVVLQQEYAGVAS